MALKPDGFFTVGEPVSLRLASEQYRMGTRRPLSPAFTLQIAVYLESRRADLGTADLESLYECAVGRF